MNNLPAQHFVLSGISELQTALLNRQCLRGYVYDFCRSTSHGSFKFFILFLFLFYFWCRVTRLSLIICGSEPYTHAEIIPCAVASTQAKFKFTDVRDGIVPFRRMMGYFMGALRSNEVNNVEKIYAHPALRLSAIQQYYRRHSKNIFRFHDTSDCSYILSKFIYNKKLDFRCADANFYLAK